MTLKGFGALILSNSSAAVTDNSLLLRAAAAAPRGKHANEHSGDPEVRKLESEEAELRFVFVCAWLYISVFMCMRFQ